MTEEGDADVDMHPEGTHQPSNSPHDAEDGHIPGIVEHPGAIGGHTVCIQAKIPTAV